MAMAACAIFELVLLAPCSDAASNEGRNVPATWVGGPSPVETIAERIRTEIGKPAPEADAPASAPPETSEPEKSAPADEARDTTGRPISKTVTPKRPTGRGRVKALESDAQQCQTAAEAL